MIELLTGFVIKLSLNINITTKLLLIAIMILSTGCTQPQEKSSEKINERWYQERWCKLQKGEVEVRLKDNTRCDCLTSEYAIEIDFSRKWAEAVGQSLHYSRMTGKKAGILLIMQEEKDAKYLTRLNKLIEHHHLSIKVWTTEKSTLN